MRALTSPTPQVNSRLAEATDDKRTPRVFRVEKLCRVLLLLTEMSEESFPPWLKASFIRRVLQIKEETNDEIEPLQIRYNEALPPGNNFLSDVFRVTLDYKAPGTDTLKTTSLFIKIPLVTGPNKDFLYKNKIYEREIKIYRKILPKIYQLHPSRIAPRSFPVMPTEDSLVLEDLSRKGYKMSNRLKQLDFEHCYHFFVALAEFHAVSVVLHRQEPALLENVGHHLLYNYNAHDEDLKEYLRKLTIGTLENFATVLEETGCDKYATLVREDSSCYWDYIVNLMKPTSQLSVLCHGDCWVTNVMFRYENEKIAGTKFVDFQTSFFSSFAVDVLTFWWSSANEEVRETRREELFEVYRDTVNKTLEGFKSGLVLTKDDFDSEMKRLAPFSIACIGFTAPTCLADPEDFLDMKTWDLKDIGDAEESPLLKNLRSKYYKAVLPKLMKQGERFGMFKRV